MFTTLHIMKKIILCLTVLMGFTMSAQLALVTENSKTGQRLTVSLAANHGDIGSNAVDLSFSDGASTTRGATGTASTAMGYKTTASGNYSTAIGDNSFATGSSSVSIGSYTTASGSRSTAMGDGTSAADYASLTIGRYNSVNKTLTAGGNATLFDTDNAAFVIGNGTLWNATSDAFVVYFNGNATLAGDLTINSDARLKDNIQPLGSTLDKLHQIEAKTYSFKKDEDHTPKIGVLAQEVQAVFPELVTEGADGTLSVNYQGLVPVLINAINEQELKMSEQDAKIAALEAKNSTLSEVNTRLAQLEELVKFYSLHASQSSTSLTLHRN